MKLGLRKYLGIGRGFWGQVFRAKVFLCATPAYLCCCAADTQPTEGMAYQFYEDGDGTGGAGRRTDLTEGGSFTGGGAGNTVSSTGGSGVATSTSSTLPICKNPRISELKIDPPGTDGNNEYIELAGEPSTYLQGYWLVVVEGDADSSLGHIDKVIDLSSCAGRPCSFGKNGLALIVAAEGVVESGDPGPSIIIANGLARGALENGTGYIGLYSGISAPKADSDWDTDDNGVLEIPSGAVQHDALSWTDGDSGDALYAATVVGPVPLAQAAWRCDSSLAIATWRYGLLLGEPTSLQPDLAHFYPENLTSATLTPGKENSCLGTQLPSTTEPKSSNSTGGTMASGGAPARETVTENGGTQAYNSSPNSTSCGGLAGGSPMGSSARNSSGNGSVDNESVSNTCGTNDPIVVAGDIVTDGGASAWWSPSPFSATAGFAGHSDGLDGGAAGTGGTDDASSGPPSAPGGCSMTSVVSLTRQGQNFVFWGFMGFLLLRKVTRCRPNEMESVGLFRTRTCVKRILRLYARICMSNRALWNVRRRHESLTKPLKAKRLKKRSRVRIGLQAAQDRQVEAPAPAQG